MRRDENAARTRDQERSDGFGNVAVAAAKYTCFLLDALDGAKGKKCPEDYLVEGVTCYYVQETLIEVGMFVAFVPKVVTRGKAAAENRINQAHELLRKCLSKEEEEAFVWDTFRRQFRFFQKLFIAYVIKNKFKRVTIEECQEYIWEEVKGKISRDHLKKFMKWYASCNCTFGVSTKYVCLVLTYPSR